MESKFTTDDGTLIHVYPSDYSVQDIVTSKIGTNDRKDKEDAFVIVSLGRLVYLYRNWKKLLPSVTPFFAVKCNYDLVLLRTLAALGAGFDCASKYECETILNLGVDPSRIIYANPCKQKSHISFAEKTGIKLVVFDGIEELQKTKEFFPTAELVLRILVDDSTAVARLGNKFGAKLDDVPHLLLVAKELNLNVVGVSFHVGYGVQSGSTYASALSLAKATFVLAEQAGFEMKLLDIGGGFPGFSDTGSLFKEIADTINSKVASLFSQYKDLTIIAEPGNYFACSTHTIAVNVINKKSETIGSKKKFIYYVNDGLFGSFSLVFYKVLLTPKLLEDSKDSKAELYTSTIWGHTMHSSDRINDDILLPELNIGDWLYYENTGAYTVCLQTKFCGFPSTVVYYYCTDEESETVMKLLSDSTKPGADDPS